MGEACDDGNMENADACSNACEPAACGDNIVQMGEACDDGNVVATDACTDTCAAAKCGDKIVWAGKETCDDGVQTALCDADCTAPACGDGVLNTLVAEECDDANLVNNDGCSATCKVELACKNGGVLQSSSPDKKMIVCYNNQLCEQDFGTMCPTGWALCSTVQFNNRNAAWNYNPAKTVFGAIRCRGGGGAGHVGISGLLSNDAGDNCTYGSSKPQCVAPYGCNEKDYYAICCAATPTCGDGKVDAPEEECDDGNKSDDDQCFSNCMTRTKAGC
jgi:cysteine-rich repeat protein